VAGAEAREVTADHVLLGFRHDGYAFPGKEGFDPFRSPGLFRYIRRSTGGVASHGLFRVLRERAAEIMPVAVHGERRRPD
jgi:hypothetical protein